MKVLWLFLFLISTSVCSAEKIVLRVASAANFYPTLKKIAQKYEEVSGNKITIIRGSTGKLYAQVIHGAPFDIFFSADSARVDKLVEQDRHINYELNKSSFVYAIGKIVLWRPNAENALQLKEILISGKFKQLAIANPKTAPYGRASVEALKTLKLYDEVKQKLVYGENIAQVMQFVQTGAADIGLIAKSYVINNKVWNIESFNHKPIAQKVVILKQTKHVEEAKDFLSYFNQPEIQKIIINDGYEI